MSRYFNSTARLQSPGGYDATGRARKTHCKHGHQFTDKARWSVNWKGYRCRVCAECDRLRMQRKRENPEFKANQAAKMRRHRERLGDIYLARVRERRWKKKEWLDAQKVKCAQCSQTHVACLEFHHRNPVEKDFLLSVGVAKFSLERLQVEIAKCDVLCANCHRIHHWNERNKRAGEGEDNNGNLSGNEAGSQSRASATVRAIRRSRNRSTPRRLSASRPGGSLRHESESHHGHGGRRQPEYLGG